MDDAELVVLNSCTVRESAEQRVQGTLHLLAHRKSTDPDLMVALTGFDSCVAIVILHPKAL